MLIESTNSFVSARIDRSDRFIWLISDLMGIIITDGYLRPRVTFDCDQREIDRRFLFAPANSRYFVVLH